MHRRQAVRHEPAIAHSHEAEAPDAECLHGGRDAASLVRLGAIGAQGGGSAEEKKVGDVEVESSAEEGADVEGPLPDGGGAKAVNEEEWGAGEIGAEGHPAVDGSPVGERGGGRAEAGREEDAAVAPIAGEGKVEAARHPGGSGGLTIRFVRPSRM